MREARQDDQELALALARVRSLDPEGAQSVFRPTSLTLSHMLVARIEEAFAPALGLPSFEQDLVFAATMKGTLGSPDARLAWHWERAGRTEIVPRQGAILFPQAPSRRRRIPASLLDAIGVADGFDAAAPLPEHWRALAAFRTSLGKAAKHADPDRFLRDLRLVPVSRIGLDVCDNDPAAFVPVPIGSDSGDDGEAGPVLEGEALASFQAAVAKRGALPAYRLADGSYAVIDASAAPVLEVVAKAMKGTDAQRRAFIDHAPRLIEEALERHFRKAGRIEDGTAPEQAAELVAAALEEGWAETDRWSARVTEIGLVVPLEMELGPGSGLPWLPKTVEFTLGELLGAIADVEVEGVINQMQRALLAGEKVLALNVGDIPVQPVVLEALKRRLAMLKAAEDSTIDPAEAFLPLIRDNLLDLDYFANARPRFSGAAELPAAVSSGLRAYQKRTFNWQIAAWKAGMPGLLNADEQGLGKTLQTLAFLTWLTEEMKAGRTPRAPILIVAPTSLLRNWQDEIEMHLTADALGPVHRFYGGTISEWRKERGRDIGDGEVHLDVSPVEGVIGVVITTYQTLANYAVSLNQLHFSVAVFDEIQFAKNPRTQRAIAVKGVNAEFRIGLTGTPIENRSQDLWSVIDAIAPGALGALSGFNRLFERPQGDRLDQLRRALFTAPPGCTPLCQRRTKVEADPTIPPKVRFLYARPMPPSQAIRYDEARAKTGGILPVLQHIRRVSAHPGIIDSELTNDFIGASARTEAALDVLRYVHSRQERALVFVENLDLQAWMAELLKIEFDLPEVMIINGGTSVNDRREITRRFQRHLERDEGFDVLLLGPRAAGTGLTLTAANHVIHLTRWWNPAVEEQCNDRTHRIGQTRQVCIHLPLAIHPTLGPGSFDCLLHRLISGKRQLASNVLQPSDVSEDDLKKLHASVISGEVLEEAEAPPLGEALPGRDDLFLETVDQDVVRIRSTDWEGAVLVAKGREGARNLEAHLSGDVCQAIVIASDSIPWRSNVPLSRLTDCRLWPYFGLPV
ncbi:DEAD/DEAH box helicase [Afifella sp. H1R]|uniref:DEAD/DEAH box helicase n=1 Tax=Afifella sp. H1R TaxID=2908841 RepID=UPI001F1F3C6C|nr:DEAD/DEAH box helicase [Afifella sp. H1R]MCF1502461.1 DEAD/DEAH box helicase [Afifella sp. H1R]